MSITDIFRPKDEFYMSHIMLAREVPKGEWQMFKDQLTAKQARELHTEKSEKKRFEEFSKMNTGNRNRTLDMHCDKNDSHAVCLGSPMLINISPATVNELTSPLY